jgi:hypothetical protein
MCEDINFINSPYSKSACLSERYIASPPLRQSNTLLLGWQICVIISLLMRVRPLQHSASHEFTFVEVPDSPMVSLLSQTENLESDHKTNFRHAIHVRVDNEQERAGDNEQVNEQMATSKSTSMNDDAALLIDEDDAEEQGA